MSHTFALLAELSWQRPCPKRVGRNGYKMLQGGMAEPLHLFCPKARRRRRKPLGAREGAITRGAPSPASRWAEAEASRTGWPWASGAAPHPPLTSSKMEGRRATLRISAPDTSEEARHCAHPPQTSQMPQAYQRWPCCRGAHAKQFAQDTDTKRWSRDDLRHKGAPHACATAPKLPALAGIPARSADTNAGDRPETPRAGPTKSIRLPNAADPKGGSR